MTAAADVVTGDTTPAAGALESEVWQTFQFPVSSDGSQHAYIDGIHGKITVERCDAGQTDANELCNVGSPMMIYLETAAHSTAAKTAFATALTVQAGQTFVFTDGSDTDLDVVFPEGTELLKLGSVTTDVNDVTEDMAIHLKPSWVKIKITTQDQKDDLVAALDSDFVFIKMFSFGGSDNKVYQRIILHH